MEISNNQNMIHYYLDLYDFTEVLDDSLVGQMKLFEFNPGEFIARINEKPH